MSRGEKSVEEVPVPQRPRCRMQGEVMLDDLHFRFTIALPETALDMITVIGRMVRASHYRIIPTVAH